MGGPRKRSGISRDFYSKLVDAYRDKPENHSHAAKVAGTDWRTAKRAWETGWNTLRGHGAMHAPWAVPIRDLIAEEQDAARKRLAGANTDTAPVAAAMADRNVAEEAEHERVRRDAVTRREEWGRASTSVRRNAMVVLSLQAEVLRVMHARLADWKADLETMPMTGAQAIKFMREVGLSVRIVSEALLGAQQVENLAVGRPTDILGLLPISGDTFTPDEAEAIVERAYSVMERARRQRAMNVRQSTPAPPAILNQAAADLRVSTSSSGGAAAKGKGQSNGAHGSNGTGI